METERIASGVQGLDKVVNGGLPKNSFILLTGSCGTGKFTFSMNFLSSGAMNNEPGIYLSLEEEPQEAMAEAKKFGFGTEALVKKGMLSFIKPELYDFDRLLQIIEDRVNLLKAKRIVINSIAHIGAYFKDPYRLRESMLELMKLFKRLDVTAIAISERPEQSEQLSPLGVEEFLADGVVILHYTMKENVFVRGLSIRKLRGSSHSSAIHSFIIKSPDGIIVYPSEEVFA
ncbi:hypothetical protein HZB89_02025 [archaeon]|nr:hypothetical protein [archaeon]